MTVVTQRRTKSQHAANKLVRRSRLLQATRGRKRSGGPTDHGLFDGLSHLFTAAQCDTTPRVGSDTRGSSLAGGDGSGQGVEWTDGRQRAAGGQQRRTSGVMRRGPRGYDGAPPKGKSPCSSLHATHIGPGPGGPVLVTLRSLLTAPLSHSLVRLLYLAVVAAHLSGSKLVRPGHSRCLRVDELD